MNHTRHTKAVGSGKLHTKNEHKIQSTVQDNLFLPLVRRLIKHAVSMTKKITHSNC